MLLTPANLLYRTEKAGANEIPISGAPSVDAWPGGASSATASQAESAKSAVSGSAQASAPEELKQEANVKLDFYQHVLRAITDLILNECSVQKPAVSFIQLP